MKPHIFHPEAREEYIQAVQYYSDVRPELGERLHEEIERVIQEIRREPTRFSQFGPRTRRASLNR